MPSLIQGFEYDIFISYRQKDNKYDGWVTEFVANLRKELEATFKDDVSIYFDENPHDGLLETHNVNKSLEGKLKSLIFIPIISQTYCDPKSFAWQHEFLAFNKIASEDTYGRTVKLSNGNMTDRILPVRIHDLDQEDVTIYESATNEVLRPVDFIYRLPGVNRQLRAKDDEQIKNPNQILYRDQINKVAHAIKDIINGLKHFQEPVVKKSEAKQTPLPEPPQREKKASAHVTSNAPKTWRKKMAFAAIPVILLAFVAFFQIPKWLDKQTAKSELLPAIKKLVDDNFTAPSLAFEMAERAAQLIPNDSALIRLWSQVSRTVSVQTEPSGAIVFWKDYERPTDEWKKLGTTPLQNTRIPFGIRVKIEKEGFETILVTSSRIATDNLFKLDSVSTIPKNMVRIPAGVTDMYIVGLEQSGGKNVGEFLADRFEVSNKDYKSFVDAGGYTTIKFWDFPIYAAAKQISWEEAMKVFVDKTGKQGPASWEAGTYPNGKENHPVSGISWYEASAYAAFAGKQLPTIFHWSVLAETQRTKSIIPLSNFNGNSTVPVGSLEGISSFGIYDLAGNVREWCSNQIGDRQANYTLGGGWNDPTYSFNDAYGAHPLDRSVSNGFRCIKNLPNDTTLTALTPTISFAFRDYLKEKPVDEKTFNIFLRQFAYDKSPMDAQVQAMADTGIWKIEKVTMSAAYANDKLIVYLFLPRDKKPPYQPIIFFPGSNVIYQNEFKGGYADRIDFLVKSGRAIIYPVFKGTFERRDELNSDLADESVFYRDHVIMWRKDIGRTIDYLETRTDMLPEKTGYFGWSWGGFMGGIIPAIETRIKAVVLHVGGMEMNKALPEVDQINFLPRVYQPIIMLNGKHDMFFPVETSQKPMFNFLGTPAKDKRIIIYDAGHIVPRNELIKESLLWYDHYLGSVK
jgi:formylglycine-generating enzyme required for sulfatase activity/dienelactone hydrolase